MPGLLRYAVATGLVTALFLSAGCGKSADKPAVPSPVRQIDTSGLPALGEYMPPLDGGRLEIAGPAGWQLVARTKGYVVRFLGSTDDQYPMILVKAEDSSTEPLTADNVAAFASALASDGSAQPAAIGKRFGALQLKRGKEPDTIDRILERLMFTTVLGGRTYVLELRTRQDRVNESQDMLFAVVAGMREVNAEPSAESSTTEDGGEASQQVAPAEGKSPTDGGQKELDELFE